MARMRSLRSLAKRELEPSVLIALILGIIAAIALAVTIFLVKRLGDRQSEDPSDIEASFQTSMSQSRMVQPSIPQYQTPGATVIISNNKRLETHSFNLRTSNRGVESISSLPTLDSSSIPTTDSPSGITSPSISSIRPSLDSTSNLGSMTFAPHNPTPDVKRPAPKSRRKLTLEVPPIARLPLIIDPSTSPQSQNSRVSVSVQDYYFPSSPASSTRHTINSARQSISSTRQSISSTTQSTKSTRKMRPSSLKVSIPQGKMARSEIDREDSG